MKKLDKLLSLLFILILVVYLPSQIIYSTPYNQATATNNSVLLPEVSEVDTTEMSSNDWGFVLELDPNNKDKNDFSFIKDNKGDNESKWILYVGIFLIFLSIAGLLYVIISSISRKKNKKHRSKH